MVNANGCVFEVVGDVLCITTAAGDLILADAVDLPLLEGHSWFVHGGGYAYAKIGGRHVRMHRLLLGVGADRVVDHINHNRLDNRRANLRACTPGENCRNSVRADGGVVGIGRTTDGRYFARIAVDGKRYWLGCFKSFEDALDARVEAELVYHGEFGIHASRELSRANGVCL